MSRNLCYYLAKMIHILKYENLVNFKCTFFRTLFWYSFTVMINSEPQLFNSHSISFISSSGNFTKPGVTSSFEIPTNIKVGFTHKMASLSSKLKRQWHVNQRKKETDTIVKSTGSPAPTRLRQIAFASKHPDRERYLLVRIILNFIVLSIIYVGSESPIVQMSSSFGHVPLVFLF